MTIETFKTWVIGIGTFVMVMGAISALDHCIENTDAKWIDKKLDEHFTK